ncbi:12760_t:CDS:2 [Funneliformis geosporum]|uniref:12760_t:CDS:1 n=1 Tax=Funneliformis geosporum TaxID=1117311 RepID=A0A9W4SE48_9GLOM|nr:12760_t:CDS:2 [Funneliformis geosporum]
MYLRLTQVQGQNSGHNPNNYRIANPFGTSTEWPSYSTAYLAGINERVSKKIKYGRNEKLMTFSRLITPVTYTNNISIKK